METRPIIERNGKTVQLTTGEAKILDELWLEGQKITRLKRELDIAQKRRETLVRKARERRLYIREIAEIGSLSHAGVCYIVKEENDG